MRYDKVVIAYIKPTACKLKILVYLLKNCNIRFDMFNRTQFIKFNITQAYEVRLARHCHWSTPKSVTN